MLSSQTRKIVILTASELRHDYFKIRFAAEENIKVLKTYCDKGIKNFTIDDVSYEGLENIHFFSRHQTEKDFFEEYVQSTTDNSNSQYITRGDINHEESIEEICRLNPDFIVTYGCCIIKPKLIKLFSNRIINVHLGLSPYYFGAATNFHPFVNEELSAIGYTFMYMDKGIDTGEIIHQARADIYPCDNIHQVGNRLIKKMTGDFINLVRDFKKVEKRLAVTEAVGRTYKRSDCTPITLEKAYKNLKDGVCWEYFKNKDAIDLRFPIIKQNFL